MYNLLPSPANLCRWGLTEDPHCPLCGKIGSLEHVLSACPTALTDGRYRWRHDTVLRELAETLEKERTKHKLKKTKTIPPINFVKEGQTAPKSAAQASSILDGAGNWEMKVDLGRKLVFPACIQTTLRPDIVMWSAQDKHVVMIELTIPWESRCEAAYEIKFAKYAELLEQCSHKGWKTWLFPVEIGTRGFAAQSLWKMLAAIGLKSKERRAAIRKLGLAAESIDLAMVQTLRSKLEANNRHVVADHHCGPTASRM